MAQSSPDFDVIVIGAGLSGIGAARWLKVEHPGKRFAILEEKPRIGGTWDQFRYPGIRSDSDMHTMGYAFKPWTDAKAIADGPSILNYVRETADENGLTPLIRFGRRVTAADWSGETGLWTLTVAHGEATERLTTRFIFSCAGYYRHHEGYLPDFEGVADYKGVRVHPQFWPEGLDYEGKTVAIIGSGATAATLTPTLAAKAAHVFQVQRSPTYMVERPSEDLFANVLRKILPAQLAYDLTRWRTILRGRLRRRRMAKDIRRAKAFLVGEVGKSVGTLPDWRRHFTPAYWPGQQRICAAPDGDFFNALNAGKAEMVTGEIARFTETGLEMADGRRLDADIVITATGLVLETLGGMKVSVDGQRIEPGKLLIFKGFMYSNVPNLVFFTGYTNASWTLKLDLVAEYACRLLRHMEAAGKAMVTPVATDADFEAKAAGIKMTSGYFLRVRDRLPKHGAAFPWIHEQDYLWDRKTLRHGRVDDGALTFSDPAPAVLPARQRAGEAPDRIAAE